MIYFARSALEGVVALLAEGVDRNKEAAAAVGYSDESPSSRRAWIEITMAYNANALVRVALLAEGVDRNCST